MQTQWWKEKEEEIVGRKEEVVEIVGRKEEEVERLGGTGRAAVRTDAFCVCTTRTPLFPLPV